MPPLLSVAIITLNEETNLPRTLNSVHWADEVVVVDSGSTDRTVEIARSFGATVVRQAWQGFAAQKNLAIAHCHGTWVLSLDADEELSPELHQTGLDDRGGFGEDRYLSNFSRAPFFLLQPCA